MISNIPIPDGLTVDVPRAVRFTASAQLLRLFLLFLLVLLVGAFWQSSARDVAVMDALKTQGKVTAARVYGKSITTSKAVTYWLDYSFSGNGIMVNGHERVGQDVYAQTQSGAIITVTFLPSDPQTYCAGVVTEARVQAERSTGFYEVSIVFVFLGLLPLCLEITLRRQLSLLRGGSVTAGAVTGLRNTGISRKSKTFYVTYEFTADGRRYSSKIACSEAFYKHSRLGEFLIVLYDPTHPPHSIPYRLLTGVALSKQ